MKYNSIPGLDCLAIFLGWYYAPGDTFGRPLATGEAYALAEARGCFPLDDILRAEGIRPGIMEGVKS